MDAQFDQIYADTCGPCAGWRSQESSREPGPLRGGRGQRKGQEAFSKELNVAKVTGAWARGAASVHWRGPGGRGPRPAAGSSPSPRDPGDISRGKLHRSCGRRAAWVLPEANGYAAISLVQGRTAKLALAWQVHGDVCFPGVRRVDARVMRCRACVPVRPQKPGIALLPVSSTPSAETKKAGRSPLC